MKLSDLLKPDPRKKLQKMLKENRYEQFIQEPIDKTIKEEILNSPLNKLHRKNIFITAFFLEEEAIDLDKLYTTDFRDELLNQINLKPDFILPALQFLKKQNEPLTIKDVNKYPMELQGKLMESIIKLEPEKVLELENKTPELIDLAIKEGFEPLKEDLVKYPELCYSRECMQKMVAQNAENILLDKTKNPALYELIQSKKIMFAESEILQNPELLKYQDIVKHSVYKDSKMLAYVDYLDKELVDSTLEKTNQELYWMAAELLKKENKTFEEQRFLNSLIKSKNDIQSICALLRNNPKIEGKYQIPQEHIFESIKHFYKQLPKNL